MANGRFMADNGPDHHLDELREDIAALTSAVKRLAAEDEQTPANNNANGTKTSVLNFLLGLLSVMLIGLFVWLWTMESRVSRIETSWEIRWEQIRDWHGR